MVEENNNIILVGGDALIYLAETMHKKYSTTFSTYVSYDRFFNPPPLYTPVHILNEPALLHSASCVRT